MVPLLCTVPHAGEMVPDLAAWLQGLPEPILMCDVDRYVDELYGPALARLELPVVVAECHRYAVDLNRLPEDFDRQAVQGAAHVSGFSSGVHWVKTTLGTPLIPQPMPMEVHNQLLQQFYEPFHKKIRDKIATLRSQGARHIYHLDLHSMPSMGTSAHRDPGERRAEVVVSDQLGRSARREFVELVVSSYRAAGFEVALNWPYIGGRITERYGRPKEGHHTVQVELRRDLYMNEETKQKCSDWAVNEVTAKLGSAVGLVAKGIRDGLARENL